MRTDYITYTLFLFVLLSCQRNEHDRISYNGIKIGQMIDSSWTVVADDEETKFKYNQYKNDTSLACRTIADTIWNIMKSGISEIEAENLVSKFNSSLDMKAESKQVNNVSGFWDCYQYHWKDSKTGDVINLWKCKLKNNTIYGLWELEISNDSLLNHLNSKHDPYYKVYK